MPIGFRQNIIPPSCAVDTLAAPYNPNKILEVAIFSEHRFAFYFWCKWSRERRLKTPPSLITFDWHQDLSPPYKDEISGLRKLKDANLRWIAKYSWDRLSPRNDVQIHAALLLNQLKDAYVVCRQRTNREKQYQVKDFYGNLHNVLIFHSPEDLENHLVKINEEAIYLDIDLDYFTKSNPLSVGDPTRKQQYTYTSRSEVLEMFNPHNMIIDFAFKRLAGFTIATEPKFCGGLMKSNYYLNLIDKLYFSPSLFYSNPNSTGASWTF
ncbi:MAG: UPF0489 family protein [Bacteroidetes bacterium]|nr:UPF0489 family protein [Bacteroidota bacterium]